MGCFLCSKLKFSGYCAREFLKFYSPIPSMSRVPCFETSLPNGPESRARLLSVGKHSVRVEQLGSAVAAGEWECGVFR